MTKNKKPEPKDKPFTCLTIIPDEIPPMYRIARLTIEGTEIVDVEYLSNAEYKHFLNIQFLDLVKRDQHN